MKFAPLPNRALQIQRVERSSPISISFAIYIFVLAYISFPHYHWNCGHFITTHLKSLFWACKEATEVFFIKHTKTGHLNRLTERFTAYTLHWRSYQPHGNHSNSMTSLDHFHYSSFGSWNEFWQLMRLFWDKILTHRTFNSFIADCRFPFSLLLS